MATNRRSVTTLMLSVTGSVTSKTLINQCCDRCDRCDNLARTCARESVNNSHATALTRACEPVTPVTPVTLLKNKEKSCHTSCHTFEKAVTPLELSK